MTQSDAVIQLKDILCDHTKYILIHDICKNVLIIEIY